MDFRTAGHYRQADLEIDLVRLARFAGARLILGAVTGIDAGAGRIAIGAREVGCQTVALGAFGKRDEVVKPTKQNEPLKKQRMYNQPQTSESPTTWKHHPWRWTPVPLNPQDSTKPDGEGIPKHNLFICI